MKTVDEQIVEIKSLRKNVDDIIQRVKELPKGRETSLVVTKLQEGVMWLGMELKRISEEHPDTKLENPYPLSKDPSTGRVIHKTADDLKL